MELRCVILTVLLACILTVSSSEDSKYRCEDVADDDECKRRGNEGLCGFTDEDFTCGCLYHDKPAKAFSEWNATRQARSFEQECESIELPYHEDTCKMHLGNPWRKDIWEMTCPDNGFFQTWGAFVPETGSHQPRLWYRCCNVKCRKWNCQWSPNTVIHQPFLLPLK
uniref:Uncharacterized protein n=1 Tax=Ciona savignyi TaxID=51511 RepID=H2YN10_CIOSA